MTIVATRHRRWLPQQGAKVNSGHPLAAGLLGALVAAGNTLKDATSSQITGTVLSPTHEGCDVGRAPGGFSTTSYLTVAGSQPIVAPLAEFTIVAGFQIRTSTAQASARAIYCERGSAGTQICKLDYNITGGTADALQVTYRDNASTLINSSGATTVGDGKFHVAAMRRTSATAFDLWLDGLRDGNFTSGSMTTNWTADATHSNRIGRDATATSSFFPGVVPFVYLYSRALTTEEIAELYVNPFAMFAKRTQRTYTFLDPPVSTGGGGSSTGGGPFDSSIGRSPFSRRIGNA